MTVNPLIRNVIRVNDLDKEELETSYYFTEEMRKSNLAIKVDIWDSPDLGETIEVIHYNEKDAMRYTLYRDNVLTPIFENSLIVDVVKTFEASLSPKEFLDFIYKMSVVVTSTEYNREMDEIQESIMSEVVAMFEKMDKIEITV